MAALWLVLSWAAAPAHSEVHIAGDNSIPPQLLQRWLAETGDCPADELAARVQNKYRQYGYFDAVVTAVATIDHPTIMALEISEGVPVRLGEITVEMPDGLDNTTLRSQMRMAFAGLASRGNIEDCLRKVVELMVDAGYPAARISPRDFRREEDRLYFTVQVDPGPLARVGWWKITGLTRTDTAHVRKALNLRPGIAWTREEQLRLVRRLDRLDYLRLTGDLRIVERTNDTLVVVEIPLAERPALMADGGLGIAGGEAAGRGLQGRLDLAVENPFGGGRRLELLLSRPAGKTSQSRMRFCDPQIAGSRIGAFLELEQMRQAAVYDRFSGAVGGSVFFDPTMQGQLEIRWSKITPLAGIPDVYPARRYDFSVAAGDYLSVEPAPSYQFRTTWRVGVTGSLRRDFRPTPSGPESSRSRLRFDLRLGKSWRLASFYIIRIIGTVDSWLGPEDYLRWGDEIYLGGPNTVRGFAERSFRARGFGVISAELGYRPAGRFGLFVFGDMAYFRPFTPGGSPQPMHRISGYGFGLETSNYLGRTRVELGWPEGGAPRDGVIYLRWLRGW